jgi:opacity protein-like surface antigen
MEKYLFLTVFLLFTGFNRPVPAQTFYAGAFGGLNFTDMDVSIRQVDFSVDSQPEFIIGMVVGKHFDPNISLQIEPVYLKKRGVLKAGEPDYDVDLMFSVLQLSAFLKTSVGDKIQPYVLAGPTIGYVFRSELATNAGPFRMNWDMKEITRSWEPGLEWGAGMEFQSADYSFFLEMRYNYGIINLLKNGSLEYNAGDSELLQLTIDQQDQIRTKGWRIISGITIPLGK